MIFISQVQQLIEEAEIIGEQQCQVAQVAQVESAGMGFEIFEAEEKVRVSLLPLFTFLFMKN